MSSPRLARSSAPTLTAGRSRRDHRGGRSPNSSPDPRRWTSECRPSGPLSPTADTSRSARSTIASLSRSRISIGAAALTGHNIRLTADELWWQDDLGGPYPLSIAESFDCGDPLRGSAAEALTEAVVAQRACSEHVLWGNVASAANTAARLIAVARPDLARLAADIADTILSDRRVDGGSARSGPRFRRRSCCLIYRIAGTKQAVCGDCILAQPSRD
jgi:hypothetical protein